MRQFFPRYVVVLVTVLGVSVLSAPEASAQIMGGYGAAMARISPEPIYYQGRVVDAIPMNAYYGGGYGGYGYGGGPRPYNPRTIIKVKVKIRIRGSF